jgi:hypothetical protein
VITGITYFTTILEIPNMDNSTTINNVDKLNSFIDQYEFEYLLSVFGFKEAKEILSKVDAEGNIISGTAQKYIDLIDGTADWIGLRYTVNSHKYSQLANYVFCKYLEYGELELTELGTLFNGLEQGYKRSNKYFHNKAWRAMYKDRKRLEKYIADTDVWNFEHYEVWENSNILDV